MFFLINKNRKPIASGFFGFSGPLTVIVNRCDHSALAEQQGYAPDARKGHQGVEDPAYDSAVLVGLAHHRRLNAGYCLWRYDPIIMTPRYNYNYRLPFEVTAISDPALNNGKGVESLLTETA